MSTNFIDVLMMWLGSGPSSPKYCQLVTSKFARTRQFGDVVGAGPSEVLELRSTDIGMKVAAPVNALMWHVPDLSGNALSADEQARLRAAWPPLRRLDGGAFSPEDARGDPPLDAILLEVFPQAFRRLEYLFSSLEIPTSMDDWDIPRAATPRWFWVWGFGATGLRDLATTIATGQWAPNPAPTVEGFMNGLAPIYLDAGTVLATLADPATVQVRAFDSTGLPIDPDFVLATFHRLGADGSDFQGLSVAHPDNPAPAGRYTAADRHVIVFCDQAGYPYTPRPPSPELPGPTDPEAGTVEAERRLLVLSPGTGSFPIPDHGVLVQEAGTGLGGTSGLVGLAMTGTHVRLGSYPNGAARATISVDFAPQMFLRLQVLDYRDWFPINRDPRNRLVRYTEGNLVTPLVDGAPFFRDLYRLLRATYKQIDPIAPGDTFDPYADVADAAPADVARARIYLTNAWIDPHTPLLGRRGLLEAPRTQDVAAEDLPTFDELVAGLSIVAAEGIPGLVDVAADVADQLQWWLVSGEGAVPPGACVELRQLIFADDFHGDDPRLPGVMLNADIFGIVAPFPGIAASAIGFASTTGRFVLPVVYANGRDPMGTLRVTVWPPGVDTPESQTYGQVSLPQPANPLDRPAYTDALNAGLLRLDYEGVPGEAVVVLEPGALSAERSVVVVNQRSGEVVAQTVQPNGAATRIVLSGFAMRDSALVGVLPAGQTDPASCSHLFQLSLGNPVIDDTRNHPGEASVTALGAGAAPSHPTEIAGLLREAISAGVDVRLLAWRDPSQSEEASLRGTLGTVNAVNAGAGVRRGQAIWDSTSRETFHVHHQKATFVRTASLHVQAFLGGIDLLTGRWDTPAHRQPDAERPSSTWHDVQCKVEGKAVWDVYRNIRQRWNATTALPDIVGPDPGRTPLPAPDDPAWGPASVVDDPLITLADGPHAVQITRTLAPHFDPYGGSAPPFDIVDPATGDRSVEASWQSVLASAERFLYIEDQYFWIVGHATALHAWLRAKPDRFLFLVLPRRFADLNIADQVHYALRRRALHLLLYGIQDVPAGTDPATLPENVSARVAMFHLRGKEDFEPIYVHSKVVTADDTWFTIGSANLTRRSWTLDSEINAAVIDERLRRGGRLTARSLRIDLLAEHLGLHPAERALVEDPRDAFRLVRDVLDGKRPWMRPHIMPVDLAFTHYGPFPEDFDPILRDAVDLVADPDGVATHFETRLVDALGLFQALRDATGGLAFGGLGRLRLTFDVTAIDPSPGDVVVRIDMRRTDAQPGQAVTIGTWPATSTADAGLIRIGVAYTLRATALSAAGSSPLGPAIERTLTPADFVTTFHVAF